MLENEVKSIVVEELENVGVIIDETEDDVDLLSMAIDSVSFIAFIVSLEDRLNICFPDDSLSMEILSSLNGFVNLIYKLIQK
jgi:acyl carrier protein